MIEEITPANAKQYLRELFAKIGKVSLTYRHDGERSIALSNDGAQTFKRRALGFCGNLSIKTLDELAEVFVKTGIAVSVDEAKRIIPNVVLANELQGYAISRGGLRYLSFDEIKTPAGKIQYKICAWEEDS